MRRVAYRRDHCIGLDFYPILQIHTVCRYGFDPLIQHQLEPARPLDGTDGTTRPFWSPDSRFLAFMAGGKLKKIDVAGGPPQVTCDAPGGACVPEEGACARPAELPAAPPRLSRRPPSHHDGL